MRARSIEGSPRAEGWAAARVQGLPVATPDRVGLAPKCAPFGPAPILLTIERPFALSCGPGLCGIISARQTGATLMRTTSREWQFPLRPYLEFLSSPNWERKPAYRLLRF